MAVSNRGFGSREVDFDVAVLIQETAQCCSARGEMTARRRQRT